MNCFSFSQTTQSHQNNMDSRRCQPPLTRSVFGEPAADYTYPLSGSSQATKTVVSRDSMDEAAVPKPKRPRTAYNLFFRDQQERINIIRQHHPNAPNTAAAISVYWKNLPSAKKAVYFQKASEDKFRYYKEKQDYEQYVERLKDKIQHEAMEAEAAKVHAADVLVPEDWRVPNLIVVQDEREGSNDNEEVDVPPYSREAIALLASKLDQQSINFLVKALK